MKTFECQWHPRMKTDTARIGGIKLFYIMHESEIHCAAHAQVEFLVSPVFS